MATRRNKGKTARPTTYSDGIADSILKQIAEGVSLSTICTPEDMPSRGTWYRWSGADEALAGRYARARMESGDRAYEEIVEIEHLLKTKKLDPQTARVLIDSLKWRAAILKPSTYGDRTTIKHAGGLDVRTISDGAPDWLRDMAAPAAVAAVIGATESAIAKKAEGVTEYEEGL